MDLLNARRDRWKKWVRLESSPENSFELFVANNLAYEVDDGKAKCMITKTSEIIVKNPILRKKSITQNSSY